MNNGVRTFDPSSDLGTFIEENGIKVIKMGAPDMDGVWRGKRVMARYFVEAVANSGSNICDILFGWDIQDIPMTNITFTGFHTGYPDVNLRPDLSTLTVVPHEPGTALVLCDILTLEGAPLHLSPRTQLRNVVERANSMGFQPVCAYELEFYLIEGTPRELARRNFRDIETLSAGTHTYSVYRDVASEAIMGELRDRLAAVGVFIEASNSENGPGQFEVNIHYNDALAAADSALILKNTAKEIAVEHGLTASFMAKLISAEAGSSGHVHQSLMSLADGKSLFANPDNPKELSLTGQQYLAGVVAGIREMSAIYLPTTNSYKRVEGPQWTGSSATWGFDNRTVAVRSIPSAGPAARIENRVPGADANPYLVIAANIASGLNGIEQAMTPEPAVVGNAYELKLRDDQRVPVDLSRATELFAQSAVAKTCFGEDFVRHYVENKEWEVQQSRLVVTDWEIARYLEHV